MFWVNVISTCTKDLRKKILDILTIQMSKKKPILLKGLDKIKIPSVDKLILGEIREEKRVPIPPDIKKAVYERAKRRCECCGMPLKINQGEFHHLRKPTAKARPKDLQFLCPTHHSPKLAHEWKTRTVHHPIWGTKKKTYVKGKRVRKRPSSRYWKEKPKTKKKPTRRKIKKRSSSRKAKTKRTRQRRKSERS